LRIVRNVPATERVILRQWRESDRAAFAVMNADPRVMEHFASGPLSRRESDALVDRIVSHFAEHGFGVWAIEIAGGVEFAGFCGLAVPGFNAHFTPCVEIGWRLAAEHWGHGYATEAARGALAFGFSTLALREIVSFTTVGNLRSQRVMQRIGMHRDPSDDFDHPGVAADHPFRRHVLYRIRDGGVMKPVIAEG
jgi:ribosomal-protein-alanine N-acetyltransferase